MPLNDIMEGAQFVALKPEKKIVAAVLKNVEETQ